MSPPPAWPDGRLGATPIAPDACRFRVWAPRAERVEVRLVEEGRPVEEGRLETLRREADGYHAGDVESVTAGALYLYRLDGGEERPDPASRSQPRGVHGPSRVVARAREPAQWRMPAPGDVVFYEAHVGTFTSEGTFDAVIPRLEGLRELGANALELMPIAQFPGARNWGYDGVYPFAAQESYGGAAGLVRLIDAAHAAGVAVALDVVYNHLGPEGNYLRDFGPYFTDRYRTPWGDALNFDGAGSDEVRRFFIESALYWTMECGVDALRLDAIHAIVDPSPLPFVEELARVVHAEAERRGRRVWLIGESDANDPRVVRPAELGGLGLDAQWADEFHHALHALASGERHGYYADFGRVADLARAFEGPFVHRGERSDFRGRRHGRAAAGAAARRFVVCCQNHDQVGNRLAGDRVDTLVDFETRKAMAAAVLLSPFVPLLFMGEEYGERAPFPYFVSHGDAALVEAVRRGRAAEFSAFRWEGEPPDPQAESTFRSAVLRRPDEGTEGEGSERAASLRAFHAELMRVRADLWDRDRSASELLRAWPLERERLLVVAARQGGTLLLLRVGGSAGAVRIEPPPGAWRRVLDSAEARWGGPGSAVPPRIAGDGAVSLDLPGSVAVLFRAETGRRGGEAAA